jgi:hypothetical protein
MDVITIVIMVAGAVSTAGAYILASYLKGRSLDYQRRQEEREDRRAHDERDAALARQLREQIAAEGDLDCEKKRASVLEEVRSSNRRVHEHIEKMEKNRQDRDAAIAEQLGRLDGQIREMQRHLNGGLDSRIQSAAKRAVKSALSEDVRS